MCILGKKAHRIRKAKNSCKIKRCEPLSQDSFHFYCLPISVKSPMGSFFMEWSRQVNDAVPIM
jgi:hypothetical protein